MADYLALKALHVVGAVLMVGNVTVTGVWAAFLYRRRHDREFRVTFRPVARAINLCDLLFTLVGGAMLTISGILMAREAGLPLLETPWIRRGIVYLGASTLLWLLVLVPDQLRMERVEPHDDARLRTLFLRWSVVGWTATALLFVGLWGMVTKR
ncbi:MAG: DUF2269 domain-containing protein [Gemmatimonadales bacterium]|jgi:uncharacterized membrane protein|nr:DUF2269 domain-containing protein [Gemmatimonadales bacterium]